VCAGILPFAMADRGGGPQLLFDNHQTQGTGFFAGQTNILRRDRRGRIETRPERDFGGLRIRPMACLHLIEPMLRQTGSEWLPGSCRLGGTSFAFLGGRLRGFSRLVRTGCWGRDSFVEPGRGPDYAPGVRPT